LLNSKIIFSIKDQILECTVKIDNNILAIYHVKQQYEDDATKIILFNVSDIDPLTYIKNVKIFTCGIDKYYVIAPSSKTTEIMKIMKKNKWKYQLQ